MREFADIEARIVRLGSSAWFDRDDARMVAEIGDVLALGYLSILEADARCRRLARRIERLVSDVDLDVDNPGGADEIGRLNSERFAIEDAAGRLRGRLAMVRALLAHVSARSDVG